LEKIITKGRKKEGERAGAAAQDRPLSSSWASFQALVRARYSSNVVCAQAGEGANGAERFRVWSQLGARSGPL